MCYLKVKCLLKYDAIMQKIIELKCISVTKRLFNVSTSPNVITASIVSIRSNVSTQLVGNVFYPN